MSHTVEILSVGTELLLGNIANTDAQMLSEQLAALGIDVKYHSVVGDNGERLAAALERRNIPCRLEIGPTGGHGFADGSGMCMAGWTQRAVRWYESLPGSPNR